MSFETIHNIQVGLAISQTIIFFMYMGFDHLPFKAPLWVKPILKYCMVAIIIIFTGLFAFK